MFWPDDTIEVVTGLGIAGCQGRGEDRHKYGSHNVHADELKR